MFVRLTFCKFLPEHRKEAKQIFLEQIAPAVKKQKGNLRIHLLEPADKSQDFISMTEWKTKEDATAYEASGAYKKLVAKLDGYFAKAPELKTYYVEPAVVHVDHL
jgi:heme-degrading monooxygenase HmoA